MKSGILRLSANNIAVSLLSIFLMLSIFGLEPFASQALRYERASQAGGDITKQVSYILIFILAVSLHIKVVGLQFRRILPLIYVVPIFWILASSAWSMMPDVTIRKGVLTSISILIVFLCINLTDEDSVFSSIRRIFIFLIAVNFCSIFILDTAIHQASDFRATAANLGAWRGLHSEKNIAGMVTAMGSLVLAYSVFIDKKVKDIMWLSCGTIFLMGTRSKSAVTLFFITLVIMLIFNRVRKSKDALKYTYFAAITFLITILSFSFAYLFLFNLSIEDPNSFTGRGYIWQVVFDSISFRPFSGFGYRAFWLNPEGLTFKNLTSTEWVLEMSHAHNGYFEALIGVGLIGLALFSIPVVTSIKLSLLDVCKRTPLWLSLIFFFIAINVTETELFERDRATWLLFLISSALLHNNFRKRTSQTDVDK